MSESEACRQPFGAGFLRGLEESSRDCLRVGQASSSRPRVPQSRLEDSSVQRFALREGETTELPVQGRDLSSLLSGARVNSVRHGTDTVPPFFEPRAEVRRTAAPLPKPLPDEEDRFEDDDVPVNTADGAEKPRLRDLAEALGRHPKGREILNGIREVCGTEPGNTAILRELSYYVGESLKHPLPSSMLGGGVVVNGGGPWPEAPFQEAFGSFVADLELTANVLKLDAMDLSGMVRPKGQKSPLLLLQAVSGGPDGLSIHNESGSSAPANRILTPTGGTYLLEQGDSVYLWYDPVVERWRIVDPAAAALANKVNESLLIATQDSLTGGGDLSANRTLSLVNDAATPGNDKYYGTDGFGAKGFHDLPAAGGNVNAADSLLSNYVVLGDGSQDVKIRNDIRIINGPTTGPMIRAGNTAVIGQGVDLTIAAEDSGGFSPANGGVLHLAGGFGIFGGNKGAVRADVFVAENRTAFSVIGRSANTSGDSADIAAASDHQVLRRSGTAIGFGAIDLSQNNARTGILPIANGGTGANVARTALSNLGTLRCVTINWTGTGSSGATVTLTGINRLHYILVFRDTNNTAGMVVAMPQGLTGTTRWRFTDGSSGGNTSISLNAPSVGVAQILTINNTTGSWNASGATYRAILIGTST